VTDITAAGLHAGLEYSLQETVVRARLTDSVDVSDVALLKRIRVPHNLQRTRLTTVTGNSER
jgi:hypothetical protein